MRRYSQICIPILAAFSLAALTCTASGRPSVGPAKDDRDVVAIEGSARPTREEIRDNIIKAAKECWLKNKTPAMSGLVLRTSGAHPTVPSGYFLTFHGPKHAARYLNIHIIPADSPDHGYIVYADQESRNPEAIAAIERIIDRLEAQQRKVFFEKIDPSLC